MRRCPLLLNWRVGGSRRHSPKLFLVSSTETYFSAFNRNPYGPQQSQWLWTCEAQIPTESRQHNLEEAKEWSSLLQLGKSRLKENNIYDICNVDVQYVQAGLYFFRVFSVQRGILILEKHMNVDMKDIFWIYWYLYTTLIGVAIALLRPSHKTSKL